MEECVDNSRQQSRMKFVDFQKFLYVASNITTISTSPESEEILVRYLEALRNQNNCVHYVTFKKLITVAAAHAKLCLRNMILVDDVVVR